MVGQASWVAWEIRVTERREEGRGLRYRVLGGWSTRAVSKDKRKKRYISLNYFLEISRRTSGRTMGESTGRAQCKKRE